MPSMTGRRHPESGRELRKFSVAPRSHTASALPLMIRCVDSPGSAFDGMAGGPKLLAFFRLVCHGKRTARGTQSAEAGNGIRRSPGWYFREELDAC